MLFRSDVVRTGARVAQADAVEAAARAGNRAAVEALLGKSAADAFFANEVEHFSGRLGIMHRDVPEMIARGYAALDLRNITWFPTGCGRSQITLNWCRSRQQSILPSRSPSLASLTHCVRALARHSRSSSSPAQKKSIPDMISRKWTTMNTERRWHSIESSLDYHAVAQTLCNVTEPPHRPESARLRQFDALMVGVAAVRHPKETSINDTPAWRVRTL